MATMSGTTAKVPAGQEGRTLTIADAADGITAKIDGEPLPQPKPGKEAWASEFDLPAAGGDVEISLNSPLYPVGVIAGWVFGLLSLIVAIPFGRAGNTAKPGRREEKA